MRYYDDTNKLLNDHILLSLPTGPGSRLHVICSVRDLAVTYRLLLWKDDAQAALRRQRRGRDRPTGPQEISPQLYFMCPVFSGCFSLKKSRTEGSMLSTDDCFSHTLMREAMDVFPRECEQN